MKLGSLFDGSGGFPLAGALNGITPIWASEVEPYPIAVTRSRFPQMRHLGNVAEVHGDKIPPVDVITFGSPCQDMSVAGKRAGLDGSRSSLFHEAIRIIKEMRKKTNGEYPKYAVWENVRKTYAGINGKSYKPMRRESLTKWYNALHTDSAEYKMWGNGIALPCAAFVLEGIAEALMGGTT